MRVPLGAIVTIGLFAVCSANAGSITTLYGDNDGFGIGMTSGTGFDPDVSHNTISDAPGTDVRLIGDSGFAAPAFAPTGSFAPFSVTGSIVSVTLKLRTGNFYPVGPVDGPDHIFLNGEMVPDSFIDGFGQGSPSGLVETETVSLDSSFFAAIAAGNANLSGTHISQGDGLQGITGGGSFQIDFLELDITTTATTTPEPGAVALMASGLGALALLRRRKVHTR